VVTLNLVNLRFEDEWGIGVHFAYSALAAALVIALTLSMPPGAERPPPWHSTLIVASFVLALGALLNLADLLGGNGDLGSGTVFWVGLLVASLMFWLARRYDSGVAALLDALTTVVTVVAFIDWAFDPDSAGTFRWVLLFTAIGAAAYGLMGSDDQRHRRVGWVNAAGVALLGIALTYAIEGLEGIFGGAGSGVEAGTGWELVLLAGGAALIAYMASFARSGPAYLGVANLAAFVILAGAASDDGPSLVGWPLLLLLATAGLLVFALRRDGARPVATPVAAGAPPTPSSEDTTQIQPDP
jgi:energy-converting hydrogenase Eha subunit A